MNRRRAWGRTSLCLALVSLGLLLLSACPSRGPAPRSANDEAPSFFMGDLRVCSVDRWCWENPMPQGNDLLSVWSRSATQLCAVGRDGTALHFNGNVWRREPTGIQRDLNAVWGPPLGADKRQEEFIAVGRRGALLHFREGRWQWRLSGTQADLYAIWGPSDGVAKERSVAHVQPEFLVVGAVGTLLSCRNKGCRSVPAQTRAPLYAIGGQGGRVWVAGAGIVLHRTSAKAPWVRLTGANGLTLRTIWVDSQAKQPSALIGGDRGVLLRCNAKSCLPQTTPATTQPTTLPTTQPTTLPTTLPTKARLALGADDKVSARDDIVFLGAAGAAPLALTVGDGRTAVWQLRKQGQRWQRDLVQHLRPLQLRALTRLDTEHVVAVGDGGVLLRKSQGDWQQEMPTGTARRLQTVWGRTSTDVFAAGAGGTLVHHDGRSWDPVDTSVKVALRGVTDNGQGGVFVVGAAGTLLTCDDKRCERQNLPTRAGLHDVWHGQGRTVVVGEGGLVLERRGQSWQTIASASAADLHAVCGLANGDLYVAGRGGRLARLHGGKLTAVISGTTATLWALGCDGEDVWAVGDDVALRCKKQRCETVPLRLPPRRRRDDAPAATAQSQPQRAPASAPVTSKSRSAAHTATLPRRRRSRDLRRRYGKLRLRGIFIDARHRVHVMGIPGRVLFYLPARADRPGRPAGWRMQLSAYAGRLRALWGSRSGHLFAVGDAGVILQRIPRSQDSDATSAPTSRPLK